MPPLVRFVGMHRLYLEKAAISFVYFGALMLNSICIPILVKTSFREYTEEQLVATLFGSNTDFGDAWYHQFSYLLLVNTFVLATTPLLNVFLSLVWLKLSKFTKREFLYAHHTNNETDNMKYLELNAGPEYQFEMKTAPLNAVLLTTLVFGLAFPLLYVVALFALIVQYLTERITLALLYRLPQKYSLSLTLQNAHILAFSPVVSSAIAFWMMGNKQIFGSRQPGALSTKDDIALSNHTLTAEAQDLMKGNLTILENVYLIALVLTAFFSVIYYLAQLMILKPPIDQQALI